MDEVLANTSVRLNEGLKEIEERGYPACESSGYCKMENKMKIFIQPVLIHNYFVQANY